MPWPLSGTFMKKGNKLAGMAKYKLTYKPYGESALLIEWPSRIELAILEDIIWFQKTIEKELTKEIVECIPAYHSLTITFDPGKINYNDLIQNVQHLKYSNDYENLLQRRRWFIPVCYDPEFGPDQEKVAEAANLSVKKAIEIHFSTVYTVYFIGFLPGFLYLGGLPEILHTARKDTPSPLIPKGAVAIGGAQAGIYPQDSPGGWQIIGRTPVQLFNAITDPPCFALAGDLLQFKPIEKNEYVELKEQVKKGEYKIKMDLPDI